VAFMSFLKSDFHKYKLKHLMHLYIFHVSTAISDTWTSLVAQVKHPSAMQETQVQFPGRSPGEGNDYPLQYPCLENSMDRGSWWARVHEGHKKSDTIEQLTVSQTGISLQNYLFSKIWLPSLLNQLNKCPPSLCSVQGILLNAGDTILRTL